YPQQNDARARTPRRCEDRSLARRRSSAQSGRAAGNPGPCAAFAALQGLCTSLDAEAADGRLLGSATQPARPDAGSATNAARSRWMRLRIAPFFAPVSDNMRNL